MEPAARGPDGMTLAAFAAAVTIGAANFIGVSVSNRELEPFWGAGLRFALAATIFTGIALALRLRWPRGRDLWLTAVYGALSFAVSYALMYWALVRVSAGVATVVLALVPLTTLLLAALQRLERLRWRNGAGAMFAAAGIVWISVGSDELVLPLSALVAMLLATFSIAQAVILGKRISGNHPAMTNAVGMLVGAPLLLALSALAGEPWVVPRSGEVVLAVGYLVTVGSVGLFVLMLLIVRRWTASASSYMFVLFPIVTMLLDTAVTGAPLTARGLSGALLVMIGVWFGALSPGARRAGTSPAPAPAVSVPATPPAAPGDRR